MNDVTRSHLPIGRCSLNFKVSAAAPVWGCLGYRRSSDKPPSATMSTVKSSLLSLTKMFADKTQEFLNDIDNVHMVWLEEIQQEAKLMFSSDSNFEPELMPKTPSQKKNSRRKRVSVGRQEDSQFRRRLSRGRRSNLRSVTIKQLDFISENAIADVSAAGSSTGARPKRTTRKNKQSIAEIAEDVNQPSRTIPEIQVECNKKPELVEDESVAKNTEVDNTDVPPEEPCDVRRHSPIKIESPNVVVSISASERLSAEQEIQPIPSPGRSAAKIAIAGNGRSSRRSSVRCSLKARRSLASLRHSMMQESLRRSSRRSLLKKNASRKANSSRSSIIDSTSPCESMEEIDEVASEPVTTDPEVAMITSADPPEPVLSEQPLLAHVTRSVAVNSPKLAPPSLYSPERYNEQKTSVNMKQSPLPSQRSTNCVKRKTASPPERPTKRFSNLKNNQSAPRPHMKSFLHTVQKNQMLMTPTAYSRSSVVKSFIRQNTPLKFDPKARERQKLEALRKKQEQEEERMRKMEEEKKKKQEEYKRKRDERLRKVTEAKEKEVQREEEKKKKIEQKMANIDEKNDKRQAAEMAKKRTATKRQEELEQKRKLEEEMKRKKIQQAEEEKRQQELLTKKAKEDELKPKKLAEARRALELESQRLAAAERERVEKEKAFALQRELERAAREKEEKRKQILKFSLFHQEEEQQRLAAEEKAAKDKEAAAAAAIKVAKKAVPLNVTMDVENSLLKTPAGKGVGLNVTVDVEKSPQSYSITPKGVNKTLTLSKNPENYGMDLNSDDSTDDESKPRKPIPSWAKGHNLEQIILRQYFNPPDMDSFFGPIEPPKLEKLFYKRKSRYFKRTSSAVWHSPPNASKY
ncbi:inner centromere protein-like isoform X2 [Syngnathus typhle]|uniref:inner centromere protein-like isoform X2 n=1 Tax=Syngnathus typhle TaxID=161592 RepID=UPI002A69F887|nr:inner centromere protein-like isoform X2 [Syngnathus typhle]